ncbi:MAG: DUF427 domain-containing protein [Pseudomonadota bacterium]
MTRITLAPVKGTAVARAGGAVIAESGAALELREVGYDPVIYFPRADAIAFLDGAEKQTHCPFKGDARYFHIETKSGQIAEAAWSYETPIAGMEAIAGFIAFGHEMVAVEIL